MRSIRSILIFLDKALIEKYCFLADNIKDFKSAEVLLSPEFVVKNVSATNWSIK